MKGNVKPAHFFETLKEKQQTLLGKAQALQIILARLGKEDKTAQRQDTIALEAILQPSLKQVQELVSFEDNILFPFLSNHVPRLEGPLEILKIEHQNLLKAFDELFQVLEEYRKNGQVEPLEEKGVYLALLLKNHIQEEQNGVYKIALTQLKESELKTLADAWSSYHEKVCR